jgi:hypothetical protein
VATWGVAFRKVIPPTTFYDADGDLIFMTVKRENNLPLTAWFTSTFNSTTGQLVLQGVPGSADIGSIRFRIFASDGAVADAAFITLTISVTGTLAFVHCGRCVPLLLLILWLH